MNPSDVKVLVVGGDGMLGHQLIRNLGPHLDVRATIRETEAVPAARGLLTPRNTFFGIDVRSDHPLEEIIDQFAPEVVVNAVGVIKQRDEGDSPIPCIEVNALFPHRLHQMTETRGIRLIHISTDCVFSGRKGNYSESDTADAEDIYGRSKLLGEITTGNALTLRTSMIGRELKHKRSLLEWFLSQTNSVSGYSRAVFSGLTTLELARVIQDIILDRRDARGLYHVSSNPINKFDLLGLIRDRLKLNIDVIPDDRVVIDRSLDSTRFQRTFGYQPPSWKAMIAELT